MLHEIRLPDCEQEMRWIVDLQRRLLSAVCDPNTSATDVTVDWVKNRLESSLLRMRLARRRPC